MDTINQNMANGNINSSKITTELQDEFMGKGEVKGFHFKIMNKSDKGYLYIKTFDNIIYYEVFYRKINKKFNCISYPGSKSFGLWAWDFNDYNKALIKFNLL